MSASTKVIQASGAPGQTGSYIAVGHERSPCFTLLDHTTPGSVSLATTYALSIGGSNDFAGGTSFSPDGRYIAVNAKFLSEPEGVSFFLLDHTTPGSLSLAATYQLNFESNAQIADFSPDGDYIAVGSTQLILLDHTTPGSVSLATTYNTDRRPNDVSFSPDGNYIAVGQDQFSSAGVALLDHTTPGSLSLAASIALPDGGGAQGVAFSPDGNYIAVAKAAGGTVVGNPWFVLLDHTTPGSLSVADTYNLADDALDVDFSPDGNYIAVAHKSGVRFTLLDHTTPGSVSLAATYNAGGDKNATAFSPDGNYVISAGTGDDPVFLLLDHTTPGSLALAATYTINGVVRAVAFSPN